MRGTIEGVEKKLDSEQFLRINRSSLIRIEVEGGHNRAYVKLLSTSNKRGKFSAKVDLDVQRLLGVSREIATVVPGDSRQHGEEFRHSAKAQQLPKPVAERHSRTLGWKL